MLDLICITTFSIITDLSVKSVGAENLPFYYSFSSFKSENVIPEFIATKTNANINVNTILTTTTAVVIVVNNIWHLIRFNKLAFQF